MPFGVVSEVSRGMGVVDGVVIIKWEVAVLGVNLGHPIVTNGDVDMLFPNYFGRTYYYYYYIRQVNAVNGGDTVML